MPKRKSNVLENGENGDHSDDEHQNSNGNSEHDKTVEQSSIPDIKLEGSMLNGELVICGLTNWDLCARRSLPKGVKSVGGKSLWGPHRFGGFLGRKVRTVASGPNSPHSVIITVDGEVFTFGRNDFGQLGHGDTLRRDIPTLIDCFKELPIVDAACGRNHTLLVTENGLVYAFGDNKVGQLGLGAQKDNTESCPQKICYKGAPIRRVGCGAEFSVIVNVCGHMYTFGCPEYGQLGHNTDGKYFVTSSKLGFRNETKPRLVALYVDKTSSGNVSPINDAEIVDVACGTNHTIALDRKKRIYTWGFGGYGRLGHTGTADEMVPRLLKTFDGPNRGASLISAGSTFSLAYTETGVFMQWGQQKSSGEATMYPKPVYDLNGWKVRSMSCAYKSICLAAEDSCVAYGPSPTYGELGYGDNKAKSSSVPQEMKSLKGTHVHQVACGYSHTLIIVRSDNEADKAKLDALPVYEPSKTSVPA